MVRIMTIHKSKGLEFPMVLVGGLGKRFNMESDTPQVSLHKDIGLGSGMWTKRIPAIKKPLCRRLSNRKKSGKRWQRS